MLVKRISSFPEKILLLIFLFLNFLIYRKKSQKDIVHSCCERSVDPWASAGVFCLYLPSPHRSLGISRTYITMSDFYGFFEQKSSGLPDKSSSESPKFRIFNVTCSIGIDIPGETHSYITPKFYRKQFILIVI